MTNEDKIKEIVKKYGTFNGMDCDYTLNDMLLALKEYGDYIRTLQRQLLEKKVMDIKPSLSGNVELIRKDIVLSLIQASLEDNSTPST